VSLPCPGSNGLREWLARKPNARLSDNIAALFIVPAALIWAFVTGRMK